MAVDVDADHAVLHLEREALGRALRQEVDEDRVEELTQPVLVTAAVGEDLALAVELLALEADALGAPKDILCAVQEAEPRAALHEEAGKPRTDSRQFAEHDGEMVDLLGL